MSSILKALKKLEEETEESEDPSGWMDPVQAKRKAVAGDKKALQTRLTIFGCVIALCFVLGYWGMRGPAAELTAAPPRQPRVQKKTAPNRSHQPSAASNPASAVSTESGKPFESVMSVPAMAQRQDKAADPVATKPQESPVTSSPGPEIRKEDGNPPQEHTPVSKTDPPQLLDDKRITLQAIVWSEKPSDRFAIVNERIVREGDSLDDITILMIEKSAIRFKHAGKEWLEPFRAQ